METEARKLGIEFAYLPVVPGQINDGNVAEFKTIMDKLPRPTLGYCRMGMRAKTLYERSR
jgi:sulfide:quinone oxidoreductase